MLSSIVVVVVVVDILTCLPPPNGSLSLSCCHLRRKALASLPVEGRIRRQTKPKLQLRASFKDEDGGYGPRTHLDLPIMDLSLSKEEFLESNVIIEK